MSPMTKKILMEKLIEVQEQIGDNTSDHFRRPVVDGIVAGNYQS